jgi:hypothetical protein
MRERRRGEGEKEREREREREEQKAGSYQDVETQVAQLKISQQ